MQQQGFVRLLIDGRAVELNAALTALGNSQSGEAHVVVDRLAVRPDVRGRLDDSLEVCGREADGRVEILLLTEDPEGIVALIQSRFP